jgi:2,5-diamino-6-(ribosylamino)-4(3H)-pyrimidinone 5'-phosphate reductase
MNRPYVVVHVAVSVDGATTGFDPDVARFYALAGTWSEDVTLVGADTILAQEQALAQTAPDARPGPAPDGPLLAVVDGRRRVREWAALREAGHWSDVLALVCERTPPRRNGGPVPELVCGRDRVDLSAVLAEFGARRDVRLVRVDSGGSLTGALLEAGLVDEVSLLVHPLFVGARSPRRWYGATSSDRDADRCGVLELIDVERLDGDLIWSRHRIRH